MENKEELFNILIISLDDVFTKNLSRSLADHLDMFVADCRELIEYDLIDSQNVLKTCGVEYLKKRERKVLDNCSIYQNTVLSINVDLFKDNVGCFKNSLIIYLKLKEKMVQKSINKIAYENYDQFLTEHCDYIVPVDKMSIGQITDKIINKMGESI